MKLARLFLAAMLVVSVGTVTAQAQSIFLFAGPHTIQSDAEEFDVEGKLPVRNSGDTQLDIKVRMFVEEKMDGQDIYFCWDQCFPPTIVESGTVRLMPGESSDLFSAHINPNGVSGKAVVRFEFFPVDEPEKIVTTRFIFEIGETATDVDEFGGAIVAPQLTSFPSPAIESVELSFEIPGSFNNAQLTVHNLFGNEIATIPVTAVRGSTLLDVTGYNPGVYFYTLTVDNQRLLSKKFVVKR